MISVKEAQEIIKQNIPQKKQQILPLKEAFGYTTSEDIYSKPSHWDASNWSPFKFSFGLS